MTICKFPELGNSYFGKFYLGAYAAATPKRTQRQMKKFRHSKKYGHLLRMLRQARKDAGLTQAEVGRAFGTHASFVSKCESGERRIDVVELAEFCRLYKITLSAFLKKTGLE